MDRKFCAVYGVHDSGSTKEGVKIGGLLSQIPEGLHWTQGVTHHDYTREKTEHVEEYNQGCFDQ